MTDAQFLDVYLDRFAGRSDTYALRLEYEKDGKTTAFYAPSTYDSSDPKKQGTVDWVRDVTKKIGSQEYGEKSAWAHLKGKQFIGIYPIHDDSTVKLFVLDFDGKTGDPWIEALRQKQTFQDEAGIRTYLERSRSGNGYHVWGFLEEPMDAGKVRRALAPFILSSEAYDRMFPNQDGVTEALPLGNLIALPLYGPGVKEGKGAFVVPGPSGEVIEVQDQKGYLARTELIPIDVMYKLYEDAPPAPSSAGNPTPRSGPAKEEEGIPGAYKVISQDYGCAWIRWHWDSPGEVTEPEWHALACQFAQLRHGRELFHRFSARDPVRYNASDTDAKFDHALEKNAPHTCEYIRENLHGPPCTCDTRFPDRVTHPYELANISVAELVESLEQGGRIQSGKIGLVQAVKWAQEVEQNPLMGRGLSYGIKTLDKHTGIRNGELIIIGARPGLGKSALGMSIAYNLAVSDTPVYFYSMEMTSEQLWRRALCCGSGVDHTKLLTGRLDKEDWKKVNNLIKDIENRKSFPFFIDDRTRDTDAIFDSVGELIFEHGPGPIIVDYIQLAKKRRGESTHEAVSRFAYDFKYMAKVLGVPVIALAQLNRSADDATADSTSYDSWLRSAGELEQAADVILFILGEKAPGVVERAIVFHKERHRGGGHRVMVDFDQTTQRWGEQGTYKTTASGRPVKPRMGPIRKSVLNDRSPLWDEAA